MSEDISEDVTWNPLLEEFFSSTGEKAHCLSIMHHSAEAHYSFLRTFIDLPVIALSSVTGFCSVGSSMMFDDQKIASITLGVVSLFVGFLNSVGTYFGFAKRAEAHRITSLQYARLYRFLNIEMTLPRDERMPPSKLLKYCKEQYDRLQEISPLLPKRIVEEFKAKFDKIKDVSKPEEANGLEKITVFTNQDTSSDTPVELFPELAQSIKDKNLGSPPS